MRGKRKTKITQEKNIINNSQAKKQILRKIIQIAKKIQRAQENTSRLRRDGHATTRRTLGAFSSFFFFRHVFVFFFFFSGATCLWGAGLFIMLCFSYPVRWQRSCICPSSLLLHLFAMLKNVGCKRIMFTSVWTVDTELASP